MEVQDTRHWEGAKQGGKMWKCKTLEAKQGVEVQDTGHWEGAKQGGKMWKCKTLDTGRGPSKAVRYGSARHWALGGGQARG